MLDCSTEMITQEQTCDQCAPDRICNVVLERLEVKKKRGKGCYIAIFMPTCTLYDSVSVGFILSPGGITNKSILKSEMDYQEGK